MSRPGRQLDRNRILDGDWCPTSGKEGFDTEAAALANLATVRSHDASRPEPGNAYLCKACGKFHMRSFARRPRRRELGNLRNGPRRTR